MNIKIGLALIGLMCISDISMGAPATSTVGNQSELEAAEGQIIVENGVGIAISGSDNIDYEKPVDITLTGTHSSGRGISVWNGNSLKVGGTTLKWHADLEAPPVTTASIVGVYASQDATVDLGDHSDIEINMNSSGEVKGIATVGRGAVINTGNNSTLKVKQSGSKNLYGVEASYGKVEIGENNQIFVEKESTDTDPGKTAWGIFANHGGNVVIEKDLYLNVSSLGSSEASACGILAGGSTGAGTVELNGGEIFVKSDSTNPTALASLRANNNGKITANQAVYHIEGNMFASGTGSISANFDEGSEFTGLASAQSGGEIDFNMAGTTWDMTDDSTLTSLHFTGTESTVNFVGKDRYEPLEDRYNTLTVDSLSGEGGHYHMRTDIVGDKGDLLVVGNGGVSGAHLVSVENNGSFNTTGEEVLTIIKTQDNNAINYFDLTDQVELGGYLYDLLAVEGAENHLALQSTGQITGTGEAGVSLHAGNYMMHNAELQTLMKRLGDLRSEGDRGKGGDVWGRIYGGKLHSGGDRTIRSFDMKYYGIQVGADWRHNRKDGRGSSYLGGFFGYTKGDLDYRGGSGDTDSYSLGAYWTHKHHNGFYADVLLKYGWMESDYDVFDTAGQKVAGKDIKSDVFSLSMELGRRYFFATKDSNGEKIAVQDREGFYIEPQAQVTVSHFGGDSFTASNGLRMQVEGFQSTIARVGTHLGYEVKSGKNPVNVYAKGYFMKEFDGNIDFNLNGSKESTNYADSWFVYGIGATAKLGTRHNLYLDFERWTGGRMEQDWAINGGYRYSW